MEETMAHLWVHRAEGWEAQELKGKRFNLAGLSLPREREEGREESDDAGNAQHVTHGGPAWLIAAEAGGPPVWALVAARGSNARVNGCPPVAGLRVLSDRDEIRIGAATEVYFSSESLASVVPFPASGPPERMVRCGRCHQPIGLGDPAVRCPRCALWFHETAKWPCWTYSAECGGLCGQPTALDAGFSWAPED